MLLEAVLQVPDFVHQVLFELVLAHRWLQLIFRNFLSALRLAARRLASPLVAGHLLLLLQVLNGFVDLVFRPLRLVNLLDEVRETLDVLAGRVLHAHADLTACPPPLLSVDLVGSRHQLRVV